MKRQLSITGLIGALIVAAFIGGITANAFGDTAGIVGFVLAMALPFVRSTPVHMRDAAGAAITKEIWTNDIEGNLFKNNEFILDSKDESEYVLSGKVVHIPQAGGKPTVTVNKAFGAATVVQRTDTDVTYNLDVYSTEPIGIENAEEVELSYDKRANIMMEHQESLNETIADYILYKWAPTSNIIRTTGIMNNNADSSPVAVVSHTTGATGNRLKFGLYDLKAIMTNMDKANVPQNDRFGVLDVDMYNQLVDDLVLSQYRDSSLVFDPNEGVIRGKLMGFKIYKRSSTVRYSNAGTPVKIAYGVAGAATDNAAGLFWQKNAVARAKGPTMAFEDAGNPIYQADIYSFAQRMGARIRRTNEEGIVAIVQTAA
jgi:hypothetical protein